MAVRSLKNSTLENFSNYSSSMNAGYDFNDFELIESIFVASTTASVTFNNLNQYATEYKHLQLRLTAKSSISLLNDAISIRINGDSGNNYSIHGLVGNSSSPFSFAVTSTSNLSIQRIADSTSSGPIFGAAVADILDAYSSSKNKTLRSLGGVNDNGPRIDLTSGAWFNTQPISSLNILSGNGGNFLAGSRFSLYGIR
jgi:hypothetical protein